MDDDGMLSRALGEIGRNDSARAAMLEAVRVAEAALAREGVNVRDEITGPVIDALHGGSDLLNVKLENGLRYHFAYRSKIAREIVMNSGPVLDHLWEPQLTKLALWLARGARHVAIGGAYSGDHAILVANLIAPEGGICHCFEPNGENAGILELNARANRLPNIVVNKCGLWSAEDTKLVLVGNDSHAHAEPARDSRAAGAFDTTTLQGYGARRKIDRLDMILLDIEGAEHEALKGAERYLSQPKGRAPNVIFEVHASYVDWSNGLHRTDIVEFLARHGYVVYAVRDYSANVPMPGEPIELIEPQHAYLKGPAHGFNMVAVKDPAILAGPLFRRRKGVSPKLLFHRDPRLHAPVRED